MEDEMTVEKLVARLASVIESDKWPWFVTTDVSNFEERQRERHIERISKIIFEEGGLIALAREALVGRERLRLAEAVCEAASRIWYHSDGDPGGKFSAAIAAYNAGKTEGTR